LEPKTLIENEEKYLSLLRRVLDEGVTRPDRTGVGVRSLFGAQTTFNLRYGFPLLTTKKLLLPSIASELLWFIEGSGDERRLAEIRFGKDRSELTDKQTIWTANAEAPYWKGRAAHDGDLGRVYGVQWRHWRKPVLQPSGMGIKRWDVVEVDQLANLIDGLKRDPFGRRHILSAWNPGEIDDMALPPCHVMCQFYVAGDELSCLLYQRSNDLFLGSPYNIASYSMLTMMIAQVCGFRPGDFIYSQGDVHIYMNHIDAVEEQLARTPKAQPQLYIEPGIRRLEDYEMEHFEMIGYDPYPAIRAPMAV
jgi:thymidylate synthase